MLFFCNYIVFTKLPWLGDSEESFRYRVKLPTCLPHTVEASHCPLIPNFLVFGVTRPWVTVVLAVFRVALCFFYSFVFLCDFSKRLNHHKCFLERSSHLENALIELASTSLNRRSITKVRRHQSISLVVFCVPLNKCFQRSLPIHI